MENLKNCLKMDQKNSKEKKKKAFSCIVVYIYILSKFIKYDMYN